MYAIYGNMAPINTPPMLAYIYIYIPYMDPMGNRIWMNLALFVHLYIYICIVPKPSVCTQEKKTG